MTSDDGAVLSDAHLAQAASNAAVEWLITISEDTASVRGPGWYEADCRDCDWITSGSEPVVEDAAHEHVGERHAAFLAFLTRTLADAIRYQRRS